MSKKTSLFIGVLIVILITGGLWYAKNKKQRIESKNQKSEVNKTEEKRDLDQKDYKNIAVDNGNGVKFIFEVPTEWLVETRNARGYETMTEEKMREFLSTSYAGDIKSNSQLTSDYTDLPGKMLEKMSIKEMKKAFENKKTKYNYNVGFPNASISSGKPIDAIWYSDNNASQIDFYVVSNVQAENRLDEIKNSSFYFKGDPRTYPTITKANVGGFEATLIEFKPGIDNDGNPIITKGESAGKTYYVKTKEIGKMLVIDKQARGDDEFENNFQHLIETLKFE